MADRAQGPPLIAFLFEIFHFAVPIERIAISGETGQLEWINSSLVLRKRCSLDSIETFNNTRVLFVEGVDERLEEGSIRKTDSINRRGGRGGNCGNY